MHAALGGAAPSGGAEAGECAACPAVFAETCPQRAARGGGAGGKAKHLLDPDQVLIFLLNSPFSLILLLLIILLEKRDAWGGKEEEEGAKCFPDLVQLKNNCT